jgi:conjugative transfer pilus assembly protein TraH
MTTRSKRFMACLLAITLATAPTASQSANLNAEMQAMFNDLGALGNVTSPGAFRGQAMNLYTGGGLMMRAPGRNYPLVNAQLPSLRAGCGGIDLFGGAFSFINKQQFVALLQNIGSNAIGYAFKLALQSISPDIDKLLTELQDQMNKINAMNINSCEAAQSLVNGLVGEYDNSVQSGCANISQYLGSVTDRVDARLTCATNAPSVVKNAANSGDPNVRNATFVKGNVIWLALNQVGGTISQQEKELIMSVIGSVILYPPADDGSGAMPRYIEPSIVGLRDLLLGSGASATEGNVDIEVYVCDEAGRVPQPRPHHRLRQTLHAPGVRAAAPPIRQHRHAHAANACRHRLHQQHHGTGLQDAGRGQRRARLQHRRDPDRNLQGRDRPRLRRDFPQPGDSPGIERALADPEAHRVEQQYVETLRQNAQEAHRQLLAEKQTAYAKVRSVSSMTQDLQTLERQLWSSMPSTVKAMLDFSANSGARGS